MPVGIISPSQAPVAVALLFGAHSLNGSDRCVIEAGAPLIQRDVELRDRPLEHHATPAADAD